MSSLRSSFVSLAVSVVLLAACAHSTASTNKDDEGAAGSAGAAGDAGAAGAAGAAGGAAGTGGAGAGGAGGNPFGGAGGSTGGTGGFSPGKSVVINEVATSGPSGNADDEFVELFNPTSSDVSLSGYVLKYASKSGSSGIKTWEGASGDKIVAGGYFVLGGSKFSGSSKGDLTLAMAKDGGGLALYDGTTLKDKMAWNTGNEFVDGAPAPVSGDADTASRIPDGQDTNDNGADFQLGKRTPGAANAL